MSKLRLRIFDGTRQPFSAPAQFLITITDGNQKQQVREYYTQNDITFDLPFFDNFGDQYTALVWVDGYKQAGYTPIQLSDKTEQTLDIMLIPNNPSFNFADAGWDVVKAKYPFIADGVDDATGQGRYENFLETQPKALACLLNIGEAAGRISLTQGTPLDYIKQLLWTAPFAPAQDRFFAWCNVRLIEQIKIGAAAGEFAVEIDPGLLHPGATSSWKQVQFGEANVQFTFHENNKATIGGVDCVILEPDIDYYKDPAAHILLEVIPNALTHSLTDPAEVYVLRWIAGQRASRAEFAPLYVIPS